MKRTDHIYDVYTFAEQLSDAQCAEIMHEFLMGIMEYAALRAKLSERHALRAELRVRLIRRLRNFLNFVSLCFGFFICDYLASFLRSDKDIEMRGYLICVMSPLIGFLVWFLLDIVFLFIPKSLIHYLESWVFEKFYPTHPNDFECCNSISGEYIFISGKYISNSQIFACTFLSKFPNVFFQKSVQISIVFEHIERRAILGNYLAHSDRVFWAKVSGGEYGITFRDLKYPLNLSDMRKTRP